MVFRAGLTVRHGIPLFIQFTQAVFIPGPAFLTVTVIFNTDFDATSLYPRPNCSIKDR